MIAYQGKISDCEPALGGGGKARVVDVQRLEAAVRDMIEALGEDPDREGLLETPRRVAAAYIEMFAGLSDDPARHLARTFEHETGDDELVIVRDIDFSSLCEHHFLPFTGKVHIAYVPADGRVVGLSKLARTVDVFAKRPQMQERLTSQIADAVAEHLAPRGVAVVVDGVHSCMTLRGVKKHRPSMRTSAFRGVLLNDEAMRTQVLTMMLSAPLEH